MRAPDRHGACQTGAHEAVPFPATNVVPVDRTLPGAAGQPQGLPGSDVLRQFGAMTIDYAGERLLLQEH